MFQSGFPEILEWAERGRRLSLEVREAFNALHVPLKTCPPHKRIFLFFLARVIKTYEAILHLCGEGYGQDTCPLLRTLLETLISSRFILLDPERADSQAVRFVEYKWVILRRYEAELQRVFPGEMPSSKEPDRERVLKQFEIFKKKYGIRSDRSLLSWSGKSIRDMAKAVDSSLFREYEASFRVDSRFSHPSIIGDNDYVDYAGDALILSSEPSPSGVVVSLKRAGGYLMDFLILFDELFDLQSEKAIDEIRSGLEHVMATEKYRLAIASEKTQPVLDKESIQHMEVRFRLPSEKESL